MQRWQIDDTWLARKTTEALELRIVPVTEPTSFADVRRTEWYRTHPQVLNKLGVSSAVVEEEVDGLQSSPQRQQGRKRSKSPVKDMNLPEEMVPYASMLSDFRAKLKDNETSAASSSAIELPSFIPSLAAGPGSTLPLLPETSPPSPETPTPLSPTAPKRLLAGDDDPPTSTSKRGRGSQRKRGTTVRKAKQRGGSSPTVASPLASTGALVGEGSSRTSGVSATISPASTIPTPLGAKPTEGTQYKDNMDDEAQDAMLEELQRTLKEQGIDFAGNRIDE